MRGIAFGKTEPWENTTSNTYKGSGVSPVFENNRMFKLCTFSSMHIEAQTIQALICVSCTFTEVTFVNCVIEFSNFLDSTFFQCNFKECSLFHSDFEHATLTECSFFGTRLPHSRFLHAMFNNTQFEDCDIYGVLFSNKEKEGLNFSICNEEEAHFDIKV